MRKLYIWMIILLIVVIVSITGIILAINYPEFFDIFKKDSYDKLFLNIASIDTFNSSINRIKFPVYYLNLNKDMTRRHYMESQFKRNNIKATRIPAIYGKNSENITNGVIQGMRFINDFDITRSELGCSLSHIIAIKKAYENNDEYAVILEDDTSIDLMKLWDEDLPDLIKKIEEDWDIIQLSNSNRYIDINNDNIVTKWNKHMWGTYSYLISRKGMEKILSIMYINDTIVLNKDSAPKGSADTLLFHPVNTISLNIPLFFTKNYKTTIHNTSENDRLAELSSIAIMKYYINNINYVSKPTKDLVLKNVSANKNIEEILPGINAILYININHRTDRKQRIEKTFRTLGVPENKLIHVEAVFDPSNGAVGCLKSHIKALKIAMEEYKGQNVLICEDDLILSPDYLDYIKRLNDIINDKQIDDANVLLLAHNSDNYSKTHNKEIIKLSNTQTASSYLANTSYLYIIYKLFTTALNIYNDTKKWDDIYCTDQCWKLLQKRDNWYAIKNAIFVQGESYSDIEKKVVDYKV